MKKILFRFWPVLYIFAIWFVFSSPYFLKGMVPYPSKYQVTFFAPWSHYQEWSGPVKNNAMPDIITQIYPWKYFTIDWLKQGQVPFWNPYSFAGNPHVGNFQSAVFSPFNLLYFVLPFVDAWSIAVLLQPLLAGLFNYMFLRELRVSRTASLVSSTSFMFCGFMVVWMAYGTLPMAIAFLPLCLYGIERYSNVKQKRYLLLLSLGIGASFFSGHVQTSLYLVMYVLGYLVFKAINYLGTHPNPLLKREGKIVWVVIFFIIGTAVSLFQVYPTYKLYQQSIRSELVHAGGGIPWTYLPTIFAPDFYGNPVTRNDWVGSYAEWASFIGIIPLFLVLIACLKIKNKYILFFLVVGIVSLLFSMETPLHNLLIASHIPVLATSIPSRGIVLFSFSFAVLAGFGFDRLQEHIKQRSYKKIVPPILALGGVLLLVWLVLLFGHVLPVDKTKLAMKNLLIPTFLLGIMVSIILGTKFTAKPYAIRYMLYAVLLLVSFDSYRFASKWMPFDQHGLVFPKLPVIEQMKANIGYGRYFGNLGTEVSTYYGLSSIEGYDPLYIQRVGEFIRYASNGTFQPAERSVVRLDRNGKYTDRVLDVLGVNLIFQPIADTNQSWAYPVWKDTERFSLLYEDEKFQVFRNNTAMPRVKLFYDYEVITDKKALLKRFYSEDFDYRKVLLLEEEATVFKPHPDPFLPGEGEATIKTYTPNKVIISVRKDRPGLLFLSDAYYPSWHVKVNGKESKVYRADYAFRAVEVPQGESKVEFYYKEY